jgi:hypothetical protein
MYTVAISRPDRPSAAFLLSRDSGNGSIHIAVSERCCGASQPVRPLCPSLNQRLFCDFRRSWLRALRSGIDT